jgi:hypothetical protein
VGSGLESETRVIQTSSSMILASPKIFGYCHHRHEETAHLALGLVFAVKGTSTLEPRVVFVHRRVRFFTRKHKTGHLGRMFPFPSPLAHHSFEWKRLPEKVTHRSTGASLACFSRFGSSPQALKDSSQGRAIGTPVPRKKARRE